MNQLKIMLQRLMHPSVVLSLASQVVSLLILFGIAVDQSLVMRAVFIACSILITLGIMSNPDTESKGFGDDLLICARCGVITPHVHVGGNLVCQVCGAVHVDGD